MYELLALLLPVAAASGWYAAKRVYKADRREQRARDLNTSYSRGLEFMLHDRVDEALDILSTTVQLDADGRDLRLAIGNFFRRRGEVAKALAVHESLLAQPGLTVTLQCRIRLELGMDYYAAGLLDRAEKAFVSLLQEPDFAAKSLESLLKIYQRERDWEKAIACLQELRKIGKPPNGETVAQFYCELAQQQASTGSTDEAIRLTRLALRDDSQCIRALILLARLVATRGDGAELQRIGRQIERRFPAFVPEILDLVVEHYVRERDETQLQACLHHFYVTCGCERAAALLSDRLHALSGQAEAKTYLMSAIAQRPSPLLARKLLDLLVSNEQEQDTAMLANALSGLLASAPDIAPSYICSQCGFHSRELYWRCPTCQSWDAIRPVKQ